MMGLNWSSPPATDAHKTNQGMEPIFPAVCGYAEREGTGRGKGASGGFSLGENPLESDSNLQSEVLAFCPIKDFLSVAGVNKAWKASWAITGHPKSTGIRLATTTAASVEKVTGEPSFERPAAHLGEGFRLTAGLEILRGLQASLAAQDGDWSLSLSAFLVTDVAEGADHLDMLRWAIYSGSAWCKRTRTKLAPVGGHLDELQWLLQDMGSTLDLSTCSLAVKGGHIETLKWIREQGYPWDLDNCRNAAKGGHLELLKWARCHGCPWDSDTCREAARNGHLKILKWASEQGCSWDNSIFWGTMNAGDLDIVKWV